MGLPVSVPNRRGPRALQGGDGHRLPLEHFKQEPCVMTLQEIPSESFRERSIPVLETERLVLRAPRLGDAKTVAVLANDRRIAENTARIPHPYRMADAEDFIATANLGNEAVFFITLRNGVLIGACGFTQIDRHPPEIGYWLGGTQRAQSVSAGDRLLARRQTLGQGLRHRGRACGHRPHLHRPRLRRNPFVGPRHQSGVAPRAGEVRRPMDRRRPAAYPRDLKLGADRSLPPRPRALGLAEKLGRGEAYRGVGGALYQPPHFREDRIEIQHDLIRTPPLGLLITAGPSGLQANSIPFLIDSEESA